MSAVNEFINGDYVFLFRYRSLDKERVMSIINLHKRCQKLHGIDTNLALIVNSNEIVNRIAKLRMGLEDIPEDP